jgi:pimeloyl-ACP methyl ester carboxylesterase
MTFVHFGTRCEIPPSPPLLKGGTKTPPFVKGAARKRGGISVRDCANLVWFDLGPSLDRYRHLAVPTLLLLGTETAAHHQVATTALAKTLPDVRVVCLQGEGHTAHLTVSDIVAKEVIDFLLTHR